MTSPKIEETDEPSMICSGCGFMFSKVASISGNERSAFLCLDCARETFHLLAGKLEEQCESYGDLQARIKETEDERQEAVDENIRTTLNRETECEELQKSKPNNRCDACSNCCSYWREKSKEPRKKCPDTPHAHFRFYQDKHNGEFIPYRENCEGRLTSPDRWRKSTDYEEGTVVLFLDKVFACETQHTSQKFIEVSQRKDLWLELKRVD